MAACTILAIAAAAAEPHDERIYTVRGAVRLPHHGLFEQTMTVTLAETAEPGLSRMKVHEGSVASGGSTRATAVDVHALHEHPFFFRRNLATGELTEILHSPLETSEALRQKKALAACHQQVIGDAASAAPSEWYATEEDVLGPAQACYSVRRALGTLKRRSLVRKRLSFTGEPALPPGFAHEVNQSTLIHVDTGAAISIRQTSFLRALPNELAARYATAAEGATPEAELDGFRALPAEPSELVWRLERTGSLTRARRQLHLAASRGLVVAPLRHAYVVPTLSEVRARKVSGLPENMRCMQCCPLIYSARAACSAACS